ncbi:MAG: hypothetical protein KME50_06595 [Nostoc desertorum CM1-VF14]|nr:hypothetical protein [Nostoc desertorum CM1-VF14]
MNQLSKEQLVKIIIEQSKVIRELQKIIYELQQEIERLKVSRDLDSGDRRFVEFHCGGSG